MPCTRLAAHVTDVMQASAVDEADCWDALEDRVTREMDGVDECRRVGMWCDGFIAHTVDLDASPGRICGQACGLGPRSQEAWMFELLLPVSAASRDEIRWSELLPPEHVTQWLSVDHRRKHLVVASGDAVDDAA